MKKLVSVLLAFVMMASVCCVSAFAEEPPASNFYDRFVEQYGEAMYYQEVQPHYDENNEIDWVVVFACTEMALVEPLPDGSSTRHYVNGEFTFHKKDLYFPFEVGHCVYDVKKDEFIDITKVNFSKYTDLKKHVRTYNFASLIGDIDDDNDITVMDATEVQFIMASLKELSVCTCTADFNRDGDFNIIDATVIQLELANVDYKPATNEEMVFSDYSKRQNYMPWDATPLFFDEEYSEKQIHNPVYKQEKLGFENTIVIIKSNEQYCELFNEDAPKFEDDFFKNRCLIAVLVRTYGMNGSASVNGVAKAGDTLYVQSIVYRPSGLLEPIEPYWLSMVSVRKELVSDVYNVVEVYSY